MDIGETLDDWQRQGMIIQVSDQLLKNTAFDVIAFLNQPPGERPPAPPEPTVQDFYDEWSDNWSPEDWRDFLIYTIGDEGWRQIAYDAALAAFKAGYEAGYERGSWDQG